MDTTLSFNKTPDEKSDLLLSINANELLANKNKSLLRLSENEKMLAQDLYTHAENAVNSINGSDYITDLIIINKKLQLFIDDTIIKEYQLYRTVYNIINGT